MSARQVIAILAVFLVFAPALGAVFAGVLGALDLPFLPVQLPRGYSTALAISVMLPVSYLAGGVQALVGGAVTALVVKRGRPPWLPVLVIAALLAMGFLFYVGIFDDSAPAFLVVHVMAAAACLAICALFGLLRPAS